MKKILQGLYLIISTAVVVILLSVDLDSLNGLQIFGYMALFAIVGWLIWYISKFFKNNLDNQA